MPRHNSNPTQESHLFTGLLPGALAPGTYLLRLVTPAGTGTRRLLVQ